jgi:flagellar hook protein FlgE
MLRSLFTGISGLRAHQQMLDNTANNIANVNTTGYKSTEVTFESTLAQTISGAGAPTATQGGTNATQIGLGVQLAATTGNFGAGSPQSTGRLGDMMINGDGFFVVSNNGQQEYTRAGSFSLDQNGHLVSPDGSIVQSSAGGDLNLTDLTNGTYSSWNVSSNGDVYGIAADGTTTVLGNIAIATFPNPGGLLRNGDSMYTTSPNSGAASVGAAATGGRGSITGGYLEMSNVDLSTELTNLIISERGFQANSRVITTSDEVLQTLVQMT